MRTATEVIEALGMTPIPGEGGWLVQGPRVAGLSSILALVSDTPDGFSALHRLEIDEGWQWLDGAPLTMLRLHPDGSAGRTVLDADQPQLLVARGTWQGPAPSATGPSSPAGAPRRSRTTTSRSATGRACSRHTPSTPRRSRP